MMTALIVDWPTGRLVFSGPSTGTKYGWEAARDGETVEVDEADVPELLTLTYRKGCNCTGGGGDNETKNYFRRKVPLVSQE